MEYAAGMSKARRNGIRGVKVVRVGFDDQFVDGSDGEEAGKIVPVAIKNIPLFLSAHIVRVQT